MNQRTHLKLKALERGLSKFKGRQLEGIVQLKIATEGWMEKIIQGRFKTTSTRAYGGARWKERKGKQTWPILYDTGNLMEAAEEAVFGTYRVRGKIYWLISKINCDYAKYVQEGSEFNYARPFFFNPDKKELKPTDKRAVNLIAIEIRKALRR